MSGHRIAFNFEDGVTHFAEAKAGENMVDAAYRSGINIPMDCRDGVCGTCKAQLVSGVPKQTDQLGILDEAETAAGCFLPCQYQVDSDCVVDLAVESFACSKKSVAKMAANIVSAEKIGVSVYKLRIAGEALNGFDFLPGQYANLYVPDTSEKRAYSFANVAADGDLEFLVREIPGGVMSRFLAERARAGQAIELEGPFGSFYLRGRSRRIVFIAGGTGLAPILSMLKSIAAKPDKSAYSLTVLYGARQASDLVEISTLEKFAEQGFEFHFQTIAETGNSDSAQQSGYVTQLLSPDLFSQGDVDIYLCGPPPMVDSTLA